MSRKLKYFTSIGMVEGIYYTLHYTGKSFENVRMDHITWKEKSNEIKKTLPFGSLPVLEEDGRTLHQTMAIARYVAAGTDLLPTDPWEQAQLDAVALTALDFLFNYAVKPLFEPDPVKREAGHKELYDKHIDFYLLRFEKQLSENNGYFNGKLSWADFFVVGVIENVNVYLEDNIEKNYPNLDALVKKVHSLPGVKEYVANRKPVDPINFWKFERVPKKN